jgi:small neutral amino acid transporter SnatA (MarC family)
VGFPTVGKHGPPLSAFIPREGDAVLHIAQRILLVVSALFPIVDPIGGSPVFLSLTLSYDTKTRGLLARRIAINSFILLVASFTLDPTCFPSLGFHCRSCRSAVG